VARSKAKRNFASTAADWIGIAVSGAMILAEEPKKDESGQNSASDNEFDYKWDDEKSTVPPQSKYLNWYASNSDGERRYFTQQTRALWASVVISLATAGIALVAVRFAYLAYTEAQRQANAADEANKIVQRPYITVTELNIEKDYDQNHSFFGWSFQPVLHNSGATPTRGLRFLSEIAVFTPLPAVMLGRRIMRHGIELPAEPSDPDELFGRGGNPVRTLIGPNTSAKITNTTNPKLDIPNGNMGWIAGGHSACYVLGSIRYFDRFQKTKEHITKYCFRITAKGDGGADTTTISYDPCQFWNCLDEECEADKEAYAEEAQRMAREALKAAAPK
jgi:hypothetical protein